MHPNKRRRIEELDDTEARYLQAIIPEVDVEIGLRERLAETIEARIAWASLLQEVLENGALHLTRLQGIRQYITIRYLYQLYHILQRCSTRHSRRC